MQLEVLCRLKLDSDVRSRLGLLPPKLEQLYHEVYLELISDSGDEACNVIQSTLKWLLSAQKTLHTPEFLWAVAIELKKSSREMTKEMILDLCRNLVTYDEELDTFRFAHLSVREFLEKQLDFSPVSCQIMAAERCLLQIINSSTCSKEAPTLDESAAGQFLAYATEFWADHCQIAGDSARSGGSKLGQRFRYLMSGEPWQDSSFEIWVSWKDRDRESSRKLRRQHCVIITYTNSFQAV